MHLLLENGRAFAQFCHPHASCLVAAPRAPPVQGTGQSFSQGTLGIGRGARWMSSRAPGRLQRGQCLGPRPREASSCPWAPGWTVPPSLPRQGSVTCTPRRLLHTELCAHCLSPARVTCQACLVGTGDGRDSAACRAVKEGIYSSCLEAQQVPTACAAELGVLGASLGSPTAVTVLFGVHASRDRHTRGFCGRTESPLRSRLFHAVHAAGLSWHHGKSDQTRPWTPARGLCGRCHGTPRPHDFPPFHLASLSCSLLNNGQGSSWAHPRGELVRRRPAACPPNKHPRWERRSGQGCQLMTTKTEASHEGPAWDTHTSHCSAWVQGQLLWVKCSGLATHGRDGLSSQLPALPGPLPAVEGMGEHQRMGVPPPAPLH